MTNETKASSATTPAKTPAKKTAAAKTSPTKKAGSSVKSSPAKKTVEVKAAAAKKTVTAKSSVRKAPAKKTPVKVASATDASHVLKNVDLGDVKINAKDAVGELKNKVADYKETVQSAREDLQASLDVFQKGVTGQYTKNKKKSPAYAIVKTPQFVAGKAYGAGKATFVFFVKTASDTGKKLLKH